MNPIKNLWHGSRSKPTSIAELIAGIKAFWETVTMEKCQKYIGHLKKVIPTVVECKGAATGY